jgi:hypothetical protein
MTETAHVLALESPILRSGPSCVRAMNIRRCQPSESRVTAQWIAELHYLQSKPPGFVHVLEFTQGQDLIGAMILGRPSSRGLDQDLILELNRVLLGMKEI